MSKPKFRQTIVVDFDGVIHLYSKGWKDGSIYDGPVDGAFEGIGELLTKHDKAVVVMSTRDPQQTCDWLNQMLVEQYPEQEWFCSVLPDNAKFWNGDEDNREVMVTNRKIPAILYIDDRALRFDGNWDETVKACLYPSTWQETEEMTMEEWLELNNFKRNKQVEGRYDLKHPKNAPEWEKDVTVEFYDDQYEDGLTRLCITVYSPAGALYDKAMDFKVRDAKQLDHLFTLLEL